MKERKINLNKILKLGILFFGISLLLLNCEKEITDNDDELPIKSVNKKSYNRTSLEELKNDKLFTKLTSEFSIEPLFDIKVNKEKSLKKNNQDIIIITDTIAVVEKENYKSYTFLIKTSNQKYNLVKNLILEQKGNETNAFILNYDFDLQWIDDYSKGKHTNPKAKVTLSPFDVSNLNKTFSQTCSWVTVVINSPCGCGHFYRRQCNGCIYYPTYPSVYTSTQYVCEDGGGNNSGSEFLPTTSTEIGLVFGSNSGNSNTNSETNLMMADITELEVYRIITECVQDNSNLASISVSQRADIANFIQQNGCSNENKNSIIDFIELSSNLDNLKDQIENPTFDALNNPWLRILREYAKKLEELKNKIPDILWDKMNQYLDQQLITALTKTALKFNPDADEDGNKNKKENFENYGEKAIGNLLYEFANGEGPEVREFKDGDFWDKFFVGNRVDKIKADFQSVLSTKGLTFEQFVANNEELGSSYKFSPDHAGVLESFEEHKNANWVQFFVGGTRIEYRPSSQTDYIDVILINPTSRNSLLLHIGENYDRKILGSIPLSTIEQHFFIRIKIK